MTLIEYKMDAMKRGYIITEYIRNSSIMMNVPIIELGVSRFDTDGVRWSNSVEISLDLWGTNTHLEVLQKNVTGIDQIILNRHATNVYVCNHDTTLIHNSKRVCLACMKNLGDEIEMSNRYVDPNLKHINN